MGSMVGNVEVLEDAAAGAGYTAVGRQVTHPGWATHISAMPATTPAGIAGTTGDENSEQSFDNDSFTLTSTTPWSNLFATGGHPVIVIDDSDASNLKGDLIYTLAPDANTAASGPINVAVSLTDGGGTPNGGQDTNALHSFTIKVIA